MKIYKKVYQAIINNCSLIFESGGIIGLTSDVITHYQFDTPMDSSEYYYHPNTNNLNLIISKWQKYGVTFAGIFHSHPTGIISLSLGDENYIKDIMNTLPVDSLLFPIVIPNKKIVFYKATRLNSSISIVNIPVEQI